MSNATNLNSSQIEIANINLTVERLILYNNIIYVGIGVTCNLLNILVFSRLLSNKTNMGFLGLWQSSLDIVVLLYFSLIYRSILFFGVSLETSSDFICKISGYFRRILVGSSACLPILTTFDRFAYVLYEHTNRFKFMKKRRYLILIILFGFLIIAIANTGNLFYYVINNICAASLSEFIPTDMIVILQKVYIPVLSMTFFNSLMIKRVVQKSRVVRSQSSQSRNEYLFTIAVMAYDIFFFIFTFPHSIYYIIRDINLFSDAFYGNPLLVARFTLYATITENLSYYVQTFSFFVYFCFNKLFRNKLISLIKKRVGILIRNRIQNTNIHT